MPFRNSTTRDAPQAAVVFDKFYVRLHDKPRRFIKGPKYVLLEHPQGLLGAARKNFMRLLTADVLKESFAQLLWDYANEAVARQFFANRCAQLQ